MQRNLTIRERAQSVTARFELALDRLVTVELAIDHDTCVRVFAGDRLIAGRKIDDAETAVTKADPPVGRNPQALSIRAAMPEAVGCPREHFVLDRLPARKNPDDPTHSRPAFQRPLVTAAPVPNSQTRGRPILSQATWVAKIRKSPSLLASSIRHHPIAAAGRQARAGTCRHGWRAPPDSHRSPSSAADFPARARRASAPRPRPLGSGP